MRIFKQFISIAVLSTSLLCGGVWAGSLRVVTTTPDLADIVKQVGGENVKVESLASPLQNPHFVDAKPSLILKVMKSDLFIQVGMELEAGWAPLLVQSSGNRNVQPGAPGFLDCSTFITPMEVPVNPDRSMGDVHPQGNPHYLLDPENVRKVARGIVEKLSALSSENTSSYKKNLAAFEARLDSSLKEWGQTLQPFKGKEFVCYHKVYPYFAARFGLVNAGEIEPRPGIPPTASHTGDIITLIQKNQIRLILTEPWQELRTPETIAKAASARVVMVSMFPGGAPDAADYMAMMGKNVRQIAGVLSGKQ